MQLATRCQGTGPSVVLSHGFGDTQATWSAQVDALSGQCCVWTWDLRGHGASEMRGAASDFSREHALDDLAGVVQLARTRAGGDPVVLGGHSLGGYLSLCHAILHPDDVRALVLVATGPGFRDPDRRQAWNRALSTTRAPAGVAPHAAGLAQQSDSLVVDRLGEISVPALVIVGGNDRRFTGAATYLGRKLPDVRVAVIADAGHDVHRTHAPEVNAAIESFLLDAWRTDA